MCGDAILNGPSRGLLFLRPGTGHALRISPGIFLSGVKYILEKIRGLSSSSMTGYGLFGSFLKSKGQLEKQEWVTK